MLLLLYQNRKMVGTYQRETQLVLHLAEIDHVSDMCMLWSPIVTPTTARSQ